MPKTKKVCRREPTPESTETQENTSPKDTSEPDEPVGIEVCAVGSPLEWHHSSQNDFNQEEDAESTSETETEADEPLGLKKGAGVYELENREDVEEAESDLEQPEFDESGDSRDEDEEEGQSETDEEDYDGQLPGYDYSDNEQQMLEGLLEEMNGMYDEYEPPRPSPPPSDQPLPASRFRCSICGTQAVRRVAGVNAMPHNQGRGFYKCPNPAHGSYFKWEDGSLPFSNQSQRRFNAYMDTDLYDPYDD